MSKCTRPKERRSVYSRILLCYDGSAEGRNELRQGADVAIAMHAETHLLAICGSVLESNVREGITELSFPCADDPAQEILREGVACLADRGLYPRGHIVYGHPLHHLPDV